MGYGRQDLFADHRQAIPLEHLHLRCRVVSAHRKQLMLSLHSIAIPIAIAGTALGYFVFRICMHRARSARHERYTHKLRTEVCKEREALGGVIEALPAQLETAKRSRIAAVRTRGPSRLEATRRWLDELELDLAEAKQLQSQLTATADTDGTDHSEMELDIQLAEILALSIRAVRLADKYRRAATETEPRRMFHPGKAWARKVDSIQRHRFLRRLAPRMPPCRSSLPRSRFAVERRRPHAPRAHRAPGPLLPSSRRC